MADENNPIAKKTRVFGSVMTEAPGIHPISADATRVEFDFGPPADPVNDKTQKAYEATPPIDLSAEIMRETVFDVDPESLEAITKQSGPDKTRRDTPQSSLSVNVPLIPLHGFSGNGDGVPWSVNQGGGFSSRAKAHDVMKNTVAGLPDDCDNVGVVIVDAGVSARYVRGLGGKFGGGWQLLTGGAPSIVGRFYDRFSRVEDGHGNMIARNVLAEAPNATVYDAPVLPSRVTDVEGYASDAKVLFDAIAYVIENPRDDSRFPHHDHWIIVNAWGVATSFADEVGPAAYRNVREHRLNAAVRDLANSPNTDVVFAAGNSGAHDPARFAGPYDRGHGRSIWGANGLPEVFTIGAVRADGLAIGASSQGPSEPGLTEGNNFNRKPDFSAPSWFAEDTDISISNTGSSAACAVFAGWLARARTIYPSMTSNELKLALGADDVATWSHATGHTLRTPPMS